MLDGIPQLLASHDHQNSVLEETCHAIIQAALTARSHSVTLDSDGLEVTTLLVGALSRVQWETQSVSLVRLACESVTRLSTLYYQMMHFNDILRLVASFLKMLFSKLSSESLIAIGGSFPSDLPESIYGTLEENGIHDSFTNLIAMYEQMRDVDLMNTLSVLQRFVKAEPSCAYKLSSDSTFFVLLFAGQHFCHSDVVQDALWSLLTTIITVYPAYSIEVTPDVLVPVIVPILSAAACNRTPLVEFLIQFILVSNEEPLFVLFCFRDYPRELLQVLLGMLDTTRELESQVQRDEVAAVSNLLELFFWKFDDNPTAMFIIDSSILHFLKLAALKWPDLCCISYCTAIRRFLFLLSPGPTIDFSPQQYAPEVPLSEDKKIFLTENHLHPFIQLLCSPDTFESVEIRRGIYDAILVLLKFSPNKVKRECLNEEFLLSFIQSVPRDVNTFPNMLHVFASICHYIINTLKIMNRMDIVRDQGWHEVSINCLMVAGYAEACAECLAVCICILNSYDQLFKTLAPFLNSCFPQWILDFAKQHGLGPNSEAGKTFDFIILTLTADKAASIVFHKKGLLDNIISLVADQYDPQVVRPAIHAIGNIALSGHHVKQEVLDKSFHITLIDYLRHNVSTADPGVLSASCRVLHILASGDWAKRKFAEEGLVDILMKMLETRRDNAEICWRPLGLLSSLGFMSPSSREYIITEKVLAAFFHFLKCTRQMCNTRHNALVFVGTSFECNTPADLQCMQIILMFQQHCQTRTDNDYYHDVIWKSAQLFTIPLNNAQLKPEEELLIASCMEQSITQPERPSVDAQQLGAPGDKASSKENSLNEDDDSLAPHFADAPQLDDDAVSQLLQLGMNPKNLFRIEKMTGSILNSLPISVNNPLQRLEKISLVPESLTPHHYQELITRGWYRSGGVSLHRRSYESDLQLCDWETRVHIAEFDHKKHKSYKKILRRMPEDRLSVQTVPTQFIKEAYDLYNAYHWERHGRIYGVKKRGYCHHVVDSPVRNQCVDGFQYGSFHQLYRLDGRLVAVGVIDVVPNGVVSTYMWYDTSKEISKYSFGVYSTLKEIEFAKQLSKCNPSIKYYYLQGWNAYNSKLSYKSNYEPEDFYNPCIVNDWILGLPSVRKELAEREKFVHAVLQSECNRSSLEEELVDEFVEDGTHCFNDALSMDLVKYRRETGLDKPDVSTIVVCLNRQIYMYLGHLLDAYATSAQQRQKMIEQFEEIVLAVGPELTNNMLVDFVACPDTGQLEGYQDF